jgi:hypothetical protein
MKREFFDEYLKGSKSDRDIQPSDIASLEETKSLKYIYILRSQLVKINHIMQ